MNKTLPILLLLCATVSFVCPSGCAKCATNSMARVTMTKCTPVVITNGYDNANERRMYTAGDTNAQRVCIEAKTDPDRLLLSIQSNTGAVVLPPFPFDNCAIIMYVGTPWFGELNADGSQDYFFSVSMGGCGSAAGFENAVIALSGPNGYRVRIIPSYSVRPEDLVDTNGDGIAELVMRTGNWSEEEGELLIESEIIPIVPQAPAFRSPEWFVAVDSILGVSDQEGHGPDFDSYEWHRAVDKTIPDDNSGIIIGTEDTDRWYRHVDQVMFWKYEE